MSEGELKKRIGEASFPTLEDDRIKVVPKGLVNQILDECTKEFQEVEKTWHSEVRDRLYGELVKKWFGSSEEAKSV